MQMMKDGIHHVTVEFMVHDRDGDIADNPQWFREQLQAILEAIEAVRPHSGAAVTASLMVLDAAGVAWRSNPFEPLAMFAEWATDIDGDCCAHCGGVLAVGAARMMWCRAEGVVILCGRDCLERRMAALADAQGGAH